MMLPRFFAGLLILFALGGCAESPQSGIDNSRVKALLAEGVPIYDIRRPEEWRETGVVAGSRTLTFVDANGRPNPEFMPRFAAEVGKSDPVIIICRSGKRTDALVRELVEAQGYTQIYTVRHGITGWIGERNPVVGI